MQLNYIAGLLYHALEYLFFHRYDDIWLLDLQDFQWSCPRIHGKKPEGRFGQSQVVV